MPRQNEIELQRQLLDTYRRNLAHDLIRAAQFGGARLAPVHIINGIAEARANIRHIKGVLRGLGIPVEDYPNDEENAPRSSSTLNIPNPQDLSNRFPRANPHINPTEHPTPLPPTHPANNTASSSGGDAGFFLFILFVGILIAVGTSSRSSKECTDTICFGQTKQGEITGTGQQATYTFSGVSGDKIIAIVSRALDDSRQGTLEPKIAIEPKPPAEMDSNCIAGDPLVARVRCTLTSTGIYTITIADRQGGNAGMYRLFLQRLNNPELAIHLPFDKSPIGEITATGTLTTTFQRITYTLTTTDTARLDISLKRTSGDLEPQIQVFQSDGNLLPECDADDVETVEVSCKPPLIGTYTILIFPRNNGPTKGAYILRIARFKPPHI